MATQDPSPSGSRPSDVTALLVELSGGDSRALDRLYPLVLDELKQIARNHLRSERSGHTLNTTALVHESYVKLVEGSSVECRNRSQFFAIASRAMRQLLIDHARQRKARKRGGDRTRVTLDPGMAIAESRSMEIIALDQAMARLGELDPRMETVVECRVFGGMTMDEIAESLEVSRRTVERDWQRARAYLYRDLHPDANESASD